MKITPCTVRDQPRYKLELFGGGKRTRRFFKTEAEAEKALKDAQADERDLGRAWAILPATDKADIMRVLAEMREAGLTLQGVWERTKSVFNAPKSKWTLRTAIDETLRDLRDNNRREVYLEGLELYLNSYAKGRESSFISDHGVNEIKAWFHDRKEKPETRNSNLGRLSSMFGCAWRAHQIPENPCDRIQRARLDKKSPAVFTPEQSAKACHWAQFVQPKAIGWFTLTHFVGLRPQAEAGKFDKRGIDLKRGTIKIEADKTKVRSHRIIELELCPPAIAWLKLAKKLKCRFDLSDSATRRYRRQLKAHLGLKRWPQDILRHTAASNLYGFHQDAGKIAAFLGTSAAVLLRDYKVPTFKEDAAKFMARLPS